MRDNWQTEQLETFDGGVSSAVDPRLIHSNQAAWAMNMVFRGGNPHTRPALKYMLTLPEGLYQGGGFFSQGGGMMVVSIGGKIYKLRLDGKSFTSENVPLSFDNSDKLRQAWFCETVENIVIQDGQSYPIIYNGDTARRSDVTGLDNYNKYFDANKTDAENNANIIPEIPIGREMAYGNGRLWVAEGIFNLVAGDIRTNDIESELKFTETTYLSGGGALFFPKGITGLAFLPTVGGGETGALIVLGDGFSESVRADISSRDMWAQVPGFLSPLFRSTGGSGQFNIVAVNQDIYWRDTVGGIRSIRSAAVNDAGAGNAPISREVSRVTDFESDKYIKYSSAILADNRYLCLGNPFLFTNGGVGFKSIVSLDFANISTLQGKSPPAYDGIWTGLDFVQLLSGTFNGSKRNFVVSHDPDGNNRLWELTDDIADHTLSNGSSEINTITQYVEYGRKIFGDPRMRKRLERFDVYLADVDGPVDITAYWRADNDAQWREWSSQAVCAKTTDASTVEPHVFKLLNKQQRPQLKTFTIPTLLNQITSYQAHVGFEFQIRLKITGSARVYRAMIYASKLAETPFHGDVIETCLEEDITGNSINYSLQCTGVPIIPPVDSELYVGDSNSSTPVSPYDMGILIGPNPQFLNASPEDITITSIVCSPNVSFSFVPPTSFPAVCVVGTGFNCLVTPLSSGPKTMTINHNGTNSPFIITAL